MAQVRPDDNLFGGRAGVGNAQCLTVNLPSFPLTWDLTVKRSLILQVPSHSCFVSGREGIPKGGGKFEDHGHANVPEG